VGVGDTDRVSRSGRASVQGHSPPSIANHQRRACPSARSLILVDVFKTLSNPTKRPRAVSILEPNAAAFARKRIPPLSRLYATDDGLNECQRRVAGLAQHERRRGLGRGRDARSTTCSAG
jgi:hypothetical protein